MVEELAALAENAAEGFRHGEDELPVWHVEAEDAGNPFACLADFALMTARTEVAGLARKSEEALVPAVRALEPRETGGEVAAAVELADDGDGIGAERAVDGAMALFVAGDEIGPAMMDDLPKGRGAGTARAVDRGHITALKNS